MFFAFSHICYLDLEIKFFVLITVYILWAGHGVKTRRLFLFIKAAGPNKAK